jgi:ElaB/YqjD/DUF883 family membrane-anchored ribosome-binding protein
MSTANMSACLLVSWFCLRRENDMGEIIHDLIKFYDDRNPEHLRTIDKVTFDEMLDALRVKVNYMLNRMRQSYEEEKKLMLNCYIDTSFKLFTAKSLLRRLVKIVKKMNGQVSKELARLAEDAQKFLKEGSKDAGANSAKTSKGKAGGRRGAGKNTNGNSARQ